MIAARTIAGRHLGYSSRDLAEKPYARFFDATMAPLPRHAQHAVAHGPVAPPLLPSFAEARRLFEPHPDDLENAYGLDPSGALLVSIRTAMPGVSPAMIDWWFGWHSDEPQRYKLWHPRSHVHAEWKSPPPRGSRGRDRYVGHTSIVDEYLGSTLGRFSIRFVPPESIGLDHPSLRDPGEATVVCARSGLAELPVEAGWLVHHVRRTADGSEMRSRFWLGGDNAGARTGGALADAAVRRLAPLLRATLDDGHALLVHCSQEMSHLATFLPALWRAFGEE